jgi:1,4-alpha-glucan branching enzyme
MIEVRLLARESGSPHDLVGVSFIVPTRPGVVSMAVVGDFNDWNTAATPMHLDDGVFSATVHLRTGRRYRFKYLVDGERWENDWAADDYEPNFTGGDDSVVDLVDGAIHRTLAADAGAAGD